MVWIQVFDVSHANDARHADHQPQREHQDYHELLEAPNPKSEQGRNWQDEDCNVCR